MLLAIILTDSASPTSNMLRCCSRYMAFSSDLLIKAAERRVGSSGLRQQLTADVWRGPAVSRNLCSLPSPPKAGQTTDSNSLNGGGEEPLPDPPNAFASMLAMASGAAGAVAVAAIGVVGVFKMALWVIEASGRSITPKPASERHPAVVVVTPQESIEAESPRN